MWFKRKRGLQKPAEGTRIEMPDGMWLKCPGCNEIVYKREVQDNLKVCPKCGFHFKLTAVERCALIFDEGEYVQLDTEIYPTDPLRFVDSKKYKDRLKEHQARTDMADAVINTEGRIAGLEAVVSVMDFNFMGGSMGSVVGEKVTRGFERAGRKGIPMITIASTGGARMQEGMLSLMQMAKTSQAAARFGQTGSLFISVLTDPSTAGVMASFAMLGDIIVAEPRALVGFAGPRVIRETIGEELPEGFQSAEFVQEHGFIDIVVERKRLKRVLGDLLTFFSPDDARCLDKVASDETGAADKVAAAENTED
ncbi:MAG: acetyl-CoA carboxylase carboxyltransferase subunit beta [Candidatus Coatesbacteria bacterium]|nr:acetyl-CoA carboxylase carboxyltransferase subunit beta [Candidatus Coatesbacteria bacterium]